MPRDPGGQSLAVAYLRRSTDNQEQSLGDQRNEIDRYAELHSINIRKWYVDDAISGTNAQRRHAFLSMVSDLCDPDASIGAILVYDVTRFGRMDNDETGYFRFLLRMHGVEIVYVTEPFSGGADDDLIRPVKQWLARQESRDLAKVTIRGRVSAFDAAQGWWMGGMAPFGYDRRFEDGDGKFLFVVRGMPDRSKLMLDQWGRPIRTVSAGQPLALARSDHSRLILSSAERVTVVRRIFHDFTREGCGYRMIAARLNQDGVPSPLGEVDGLRGLWTSGTIQCIVKNPIYTGDMVWNRRTHGRFFSIRDHRAVGRRRGEEGFTRQNPEDVWFVRRDSHPAIVSRGAWRQAEALREERDRSGRRAPDTGPGDDLHTRAQYVLGGLVECTTCGAKCWGIAVSRRLVERRRKPYRARVYACRSGTKKNASCHGVHVRRRVLEQVVGERVTDWYTNQVTKRDRRYWRRLALQQAKQYATRTGGALSPRSQRMEADELERRALEFIKTLPGSLFDQDSQRRRLAIRRCVQKIAVDVPHDSVQIWVRRLPILGATAGGAARVTARLPANRCGVPDLRARRTAATFGYTLEWHLSGRSEHVRDLAEHVRTICLSISPAVQENAHQRYVSYSAAKQFASLRILTQKVLLYLKLNYEHIGAARRHRFIRDVRQIGTQTTGHLEIAITDEACLLAATPLVQESYRRVAGVSQPSMPVHDK